MFGKKKLRPTFAVKQKQNMNVLQNTYNSYSHVCCHLFQRVPP